MKRPYKPSLPLKISIAVLFWALTFWLLSLISDNYIYQYILFGVGVLILAYNITALIVTHKREHMNQTKKVEVPKLKNDEPWAI